MAIAESRGVPAAVVGEVTAAAAGLRIETPDRTLAIAVEDAAAAFHEAIPTAMGKPVSAALPSAAEPQTAGA